MKIDLIKVMQTMERLQGNVRQMNQIAETLEGETSVLTSMESFQGLASPMRRQAETIREEINSMKQMALALEQICKTVDRCEMRVIDEVENERIVFKRFTVSKILVQKATFHNDPLKIVW